MPSRPPIVFGSGAAREAVRGLAEVTDSEARNKEMIERERAKTQGSQS